MSAFNQAAFNLAAYNIVDLILLRLEGSETVAGAAEIAACIRLEGSETVAGAAEIAACIRLEGSETVAGAAFVETVKYTVANGFEIITGSVIEISACVWIASNETINGQITIDPGRGILPIVRSRMGIYYSDPHKNWEIWQLILEAKEDLITSGWPEIEMISGRETKMAITAICVHCLRTVGEITDDHADRILRGLQTKASIRKARANADD